MRGPRPEPRPRLSSADYDDSATVSDAMVKKHLTERYMRLRAPNSDAARREEQINSMTMENARRVCTVLQAVDRSARNAQASREPCGMNCSACRATRCCGACGLSKVGYLHDDCAAMPDIMKCIRCEQMKEGSFERDFEKIDEKYRYLQSRRRLPNGKQLRAPLFQHNIPGYDSGANHS